MKQKVIEKILYVQGMLEGLSWLINDDGAADALNAASECLEEALKLYGEDYE